MLPLRHSGEAGFVREFCSSSTITSLFAERPVAPLPGTPPGVPLFAVRTHPDGSLARDFLCAGLRGQHDPVVPDPGVTVTLTVVAPEQLATVSTPAAAVTFPPETATAYPL